MQKQHILHAFGNCFFHLQAKHATKNYSITIEISLQIKQYIYNSEARNLIPTIEKGLILVIFCFYLSRGGLCTKISSLSSHVNIYYQ